MELSLIFERLICMMNKGNFGRSRQKDDGCQNVDLHPFKPCDRWEVNDRG